MYWKYHSLHVLCAFVKYNSRFVLTCAKPSSATRLAHVNRSIHTVLAGTAVAAASRVAIMGPSMKGSMDIGIGFLGQGNACWSEAINNWLSLIRPSLM